MTNYALGRWIVEERQNGADRAKYGARVLDRLSEALTEEFGRGYSRETLKNCRRFYLEYKDRILNRGGAVRYLSSDPTIATVDENGKVTARKAGTVTITVTASNGVTATV